MKIIQINDNVKINIEMIYSLERKDNQNEINEWNNEYKKLLDEFTKNPPLLVIDNDELFQPKVDDINDSDKMMQYADSLNTYILSILGEQPEYVEKYQIILATGLKINIDKFIYDKINNYLEKYIDKEM